MRFSEAACLGADRDRFGRKALTTANMLDNVRAHFTAHQWDAALAWAYASNVRRASNARLLLNGALAWHNYAQDATQRWQPGRSATRPLLDRIETRETRVRAARFGRRPSPAPTKRWANVRRAGAAPVRSANRSLDAVQATREARALARPSRDDRALRHNCSA